VATNIGLDITLPAACLTRQLSIWYHLQTTFSSQGLYTSPHMFQDVVDLKEALRLTVAPPLAQQMGVQAEREGDLRVMLAYLHPSSSPETDFLFIHGGGGKGRGYKRKRGQPKVVYAGRNFVLPQPYAQVSSHHSAFCTPVCPVPLWRAVAWLRCCLLIVSVLSCHSLLCHRCLWWKQVSFLFDPLSVSPSPVAMRPKDLLQCRV